MRQKTPVHGRGGGGTAHVRHHHVSKTPTVKLEPITTTKDETTISDDEDTSSFSGWLKSSDGIGYMKIFVFMNTIVMVFTMGWPHISKTIEIIKAMINGEEE